MRVFSSLLNLALSTIVFSSTGRRFQACGAATENARSPVFKPCWRNDKVTVWGRSKMASRINVSDWLKKLPNVSWGRSIQCSMSEEAQFVFDTRPNRKPVEFLERCRSTVSRSLSQHHASSSTYDWFRGWDIQLMWSVTDEWFMISWNFDNLVG